MHFWDNYIFWTLKAEKREALDICCSTLYLDRMHIITARLQSPYEFSIFMVLIGSRNKLLRSFIAWLRRLRIRNNICLFPHKTSFGNVDNSFKIKKGDIIISWSNSFRDNKNLCCNLQSMLNSLKHEQVLTRLDRRNTLYCNYFVKNF